MPVYAENAKLNFSYDRRFLAISASLERKRAKKSVDTHINFHLYHYAGNNPVKYVDPTGAFDFDNNEIVSGDTLTKITAQFNDRYSTNYSVDEVAAACGVENKDYIRAGDSLDFSSLLPEWHVSGRGSGVGLFAATVPLTSNGAEIDSSWYDMAFTIEETKESFSTKFQSLNTSGVGVKLGAGVYVVDVQAKGVFKGVKPTQSQIIETFGGKSEVVGFSFLWFGVTGSENENWIINTGTLGVSWGSPISVGVEKSFTKERK